jgi:hypothetical protein
MGKCVMLKWNEKVQIRARKNAWFALCSSRMRISAKRCEQLCMREKNLAGKV